MMDNAAANAAAATFVAPSPSLPPTASTHGLAAFQAAVNNSSAAAGLQFQEALMSRMGRPFGLSHADLKELPGGPFSGLSLASAAAGRGGSALDSFPGALPFLSHMAAAPPFGLHHLFDPRLPFPSAAAAAAGAFRPLFAAHQAAAAAAVSAAVSAANGVDGGGAVSLSKSFHSAFAPPITTMAKHLDRRNSPPTLFSPGQNLFPRSTGGSPGSPSSSPGHRKTDENSNTSGNGLSNCLDRHDSLSPSSMDDEDRMMTGSAAKRMRLSSDMLGCGCPICGVPLRPHELEAHFAKELAQMAAAADHRIQSGLRSPLASSADKCAASAASPRGVGGLGGGAGGLEMAPRSRWDTYQRIQRNRQERIRVKLSRRAGKRPDEVLEEEDDAAAANKISKAAAVAAAAAVAHQQRPHDASHRQAQGGNADEEDIDIVGDDAKDRVNTSLSSDGSGRTDSMQNHVYGPPQYTEADILACVNSCEAEAEVESGTDVVKKEAVDEDEERGTVDDNDDNGDDDAGQKVNNNNILSSGGSDNIEALKAKLKLLEENNKCSKCMRTLKDPVVNVACWHIQCEKCWLTSLGTTKCCSLCGISSGASDLRRVYL